MRSKQNPRIARPCSPTNRDSRKPPPFVDLPWHNGRRRQTCFQPDFAL